MFGLLNQPFPLDDSSARQLRKSALIGLFIGLFLLVFQPFGLSGWETPNKVVKVLGFGLVTFVITSIIFVVLPKIIPQLFDEKRWTVGREIVFVMANILLIALANRLYIAWLLDSEHISSISWGWMILFTFLVGFFPVVGLVLLNYITQLKKYSSAAAALPIHPHVAPTAPSVEAPASASTLTSTTVTLIADNEKDTLTILSDDLLYIESSDNYCTIFHLKNAQPVKPLLRSSLSRLEKQIHNPHIVRCHRSFIVNLDRVERVTGNAQGYKLHLYAGQFVVPVARQYNETLIAELKAL